MNECAWEDDIWEILEKGGSVEGMAVCYQGGVKRRSAYACEVSRLPCKTILAFF